MYNVQGLAPTVIVHLYIYTAYSFGHLVNSDFIGLDWVKSFIPIIH